MFDHLTRQGLTSLVQNHVQFLQKISCERAIASTRGCQACPLPFLTHKVHYNYRAMTGDNIKGGEERTQLHFPSQRQTICLPKVEYKKSHIYLEYNSIANNLLNQIVRHG